jgi:hypothetical protein
VVSQDLKVLSFAADQFGLTDTAGRRGVDCRFTTEDARIKLNHLYPAIRG